MFLLLREFIRKQIYEGRTGEGGKPKKPNNLAHLKWETFRKKPTFKYLKYIPSLETARRRTDRFKPMKNTTKNWHTKIINQCQCLILIVLKYCCFCSFCCGFGVCRCCWSSCCFIIIFTQIVEYDKIGIYEVFNPDKGRGCWRENP